MADRKQARINKLIAQDVLRRGLLGAEELDALLAEARRSGRPLEQLLVQQRIIGAGTLIDFRRLAQAAISFPHAEDAPLEPASPDPLQKDRVGPYEVIAAIGTGGMGTVYRALHRTVGRMVALKVLHRDAGTAPETLERFRREARIMASLDHPNIVRVRDVGEDEPYHYLVMDLVEGEDLSERLKHEPFNEQAALALVRDIALAVGHAHRQGYIHRDLKPANIIIDADGRPHVTDFGLARALDKEQQARLTQTHQILGTPYYMAPEIFGRRGGRSVGPPADVYALGVILYELLTGQVPFQDETPVGLFERITEDDPLPPSQLASDVSPDAEMVCLTALSKNPRHRYADGMELAADLDRAMRYEDLHARSEPVIHWTWRKLRRYRAALGALLALLGLGAGMLLAWAWTRWEQETSREARRVALLEQGRLAAQEGRHRDALRTLGSGRSAFPGDPEFAASRRAVLLSLAGEALAQGNRELAEFHCQEGLQEGDPDGEVQRLLERVRAGRGERARLLHETVARVIAEAGDERSAIQRPSEAALAAWVLDLVGLRGADLVDVMLAADLDAPTLREVFARAFGHLGDGRVLPRLLAWLEQAGDEPFLTIACCRALARLGGEEARQAVTRVYAQHPELQGRLQEAMGRFAAGDERGGVPDAREWVAEGLRLHAAGLYDDAEAAYTQAIGLDPGLAEAYSNRGATRLLQGRPQDALSDLDRALLLDPEQARYRFNRGNALRELGQPWDAKQAYSMALRLDPDLVPAWINRGLVHLELGRLEDASADLTEALHLDPSNPAAYLQRGVVRRRSGRLEEALADLDASLRLSPDQPAALCERAQVRRARGETEGALADASEAMHLAPRFAQAYALRGSWLREAGRLEASRADLDALCDLAPDEPRHRLNRGMTLAALGRHAEAIADFDVALAADTERVWVHRYRALSREALGLLDGALNDYMQVEALDPRQEDAYLGASRVLLRQGRIAAALESIERGLQAVPAERSAALAAKLAELRSADPGGER